MIMIMRPGAPRCQQIPEDGDHDNQCYVMMLMMMLMMMLGIKLMMMLMIRTLPHDATRSLRIIFR